MPFGKYKDFQSCVTEIKHKRPDIVDPSAYCAAIEHNIRGAVLETYLAEAELTPQGEQAGGFRTDFMASEPTQIPLRAVLWAHTNGLDEQDIGKTIHQLIDNPPSTPFITHLDLRFDWETEGSTDATTLGSHNYLEGVTLFAGSAKQVVDKLKRMTTGGKLGATPKQKQPRIWNDPRQLDKLIFPPCKLSVAEIEQARHDHPGLHISGNCVGNSRSRQHGEQWARMDFVAELSVTPSIIRNAPADKRYYEWILKFVKTTPHFEFLKQLDGIWGLSKEAAIGQSVPFLLFKIDNKEPFWIRNQGQKEHKQEIASLPDWQKPKERIRMNKILQSYITEKKTGGNEDSGAGGPGGTFNCIGESEARAKVVAFISGQIKVNTHSSPNADSEQWIFELDGSFQEFVSSLQDGLQVKCNGTIQKP